jgi:hypothetical protein
LVALQFLNLSIFAQEFKPIENDAFFSEVNISETIVEYIIEDVLNHKNAIPEQRAQHKDIHFQKHLSFKAISYKKDALLKLPSFENTITFQLMNEPYSSMEFIDLISPPPKFK